jgi:phage baseplate assembly protein W
MRGTDRKTGKELSGLAHLRQSVLDILSTPIGSRVMRRDYGSRLFELVDAPMNAGTVVDLYHATADALSKWEPRLRVSRVFVESASAGSITLSLEGSLVSSGQNIRLDGINLST